MSALKQDLKELAGLSKAAGKRRDWAQAGGGNASLKRAEDGLLLVKASGLRLDECTPERGFVALDLLSLDDTLLLDVPLLERKRLLESIVDAGTLVRTSPIVQPPVDAWVATWKSVGLRGGILKAANSRYVPGGETTEWRVVERLGGRR